MKVLANGHFSDEWESGLLASGLRQSSKLPRNSKTLSRCDGCVGSEGTLSTIPTPDISSIYTDDLVTKDDFPFPQIFTLDKLILVCNRNSILELHGTNLIHKFTTFGGNLWNVIAVSDFVYMSNGVVSLYRDPYTGRYSYSNAPVCECICYFNGQIICGNIKDTYLKYNGQVFHNGIATYGGTF